MSKIHKGHRPYYIAWGKLNPSWKGSQVSYYGLHAWIKKQLGSPTKCEHCKKDGLIKNEIDWANKDHKYRRNLGDWIRLCRSCHKKYDYSNCLCNIGSRGGSIKNKKPAGSQ